MGEVQTKIVILNEMEHLILDRVFGLLDQLRPFRGREVQSGLRDDGYQKVRYRTLRDRWYLDVQSIVGYPRLLLT